MQCCGENECGMVEGPPSGACDSEVGQQCITVPVEVSESHSSPSKDSFLLALYRDSNQRRLDKEHRFQEFETLAQIGAKDGNRLRSLIRDRQLNYAYIWVIIIASRVDVID